jgi:hypothetical protein
VKTFETIFLLAVAAAFAIAAVVWLLVLFGVSGRDAAIMFLLVGVPAGLAAAAAAAIAMMRAWSRSVQAEDSNGTRFRIRLASIGRLVEAAGNDVPGVAEMAPVVHGDGHGVQIQCVAHLQPRYNPLDVRQRLRGHLRSFIPAVTGVPVGHVAVRFEGLPVAEDTDPYG